MTRFQLQVTLDADNSVELERLKVLLSNTLNRSEKLDVVAVSGHQIKAPGRPAQVILEIEDYLKGRKPKSAHQIARAINRTDRSVYAPLNQLKDMGLVDKKFNQKYNVAQWFLIEDAPGDQVSGPE